MAGSAPVPGMTATRADAGRRPRNRTGYDAPKRQKTPRPQRAAESGGHRATRLAALAAVDEAAAASGVGRAEWVRRAIVAHLDAAAG